MSTHHNALGQVKTNLVKKYLKTTSGSLFIDSLSIIPNTFSIQNYADSSYRIDFVKAILYWRTKPAEDSVLITYRTFPYKLYQSAQLYNFDSVKNNFIVRPYSPRLAEGNNQLFDFGKIESRGSFGRSINFGNAQDAVLNSNLDLQLNGFIGDSIEIAASLSDQNLPIQPDGSTAQLNEVDKIFIQFKKKNWALSLGDIDLRQNKQYYLNFYKRLQGVSFNTTNAISKNITNNLLLSGALARGKFTNNQFQGLEGNQGPYRLQGANNEFFFIILAGTERVYIDGELLQRGEDQDYIINYNTAEITFTPQRLITKDKRIRVEFEYSDRNFVNSQLYASNEVIFNKKLSVTVSGYTNTDAKNSPINQTLDPAQKQFLGLIGDSIQNAFYPTVINDTLSPGKVLYKKYDSLVNGNYRSIYIYSNNKDSAKYNLSFADVGFGKGDYQILQNGANGKVFVWVAPIGSLKQGQYEPVQYLITPKKQQLISVTTNYTLSNNTQLKAEFAYSNNDPNIFSKFNKGNDEGLAGKLGITNNFLLTKKLTVKTDVAYEINDEKFRTIERLRTPEFNRDWNLPVIPIIAKEQLGNAAIALSNATGNQFKIQFNNFYRDNGYTGYRQTLSSLTTIKGWQLNTNFSYTNTRDSFQRGLYLRPTIDLSKVFPKIKNIRLGINYFSEQNELLNKVADSLNPISIAFDSYKFSVATDESKENKWGLSYIIRNNKVPVGKQLQLSDKSQDIEATTSLLGNEKHQFNFKATFRNLDVVLPNKVSYKSDKTLLGRAEYKVQEWNGLLNGALLYEAGSGQEQQRDFAFLEVPAGQGDFYWVDYNSNNVQELNEFELAVFPDQRKFIKIFIPTNNFIKANFNTFRYEFSINPKAQMPKAAYRGLKNILSRSYFQSSFRITKKEQSNSLINANPFKTNIQDAALILLDEGFGNSFSFNKFSPIWGIDINHNKNQNKALLTYGYETREEDKLVVKSRWSIKKKILTELLGKKINTKLTTPTFNNRNYDIDILSGEARIGYTNSTKFRLQTGYTLENKKNKILFGGEAAIINTISIEGKYNALQSAAISGKFSYSNIDYTGLPNTTVSFIMLDALVKGKNYLWNVDLIKTLKNNLEITFRYEGRKTGTGKVLHFGGATLRATFY
jgi:hypothetical protein